ncbi:hypothetical protein MVEN_00499500 [Mycena venus]|uniref:Cytochrome P450 n=1 Tax=Mycena venus TaxID=2733690 RepID=A0A8H7DBQ5_9AGAR|nr:hypothetical protein MVEN_00499500 [Mycena venus]
MFSRRWFASFVMSPSLGTGDISRDTGTESSAGAAQQESDIIEYSPATIRPYHPADAINKELLSEGSKLWDDVVVAVTHDDEWVSILKNEVTVPAASELITRMRETHTIEINSGGLYFRDRSSKNHRRRSKSLGTKLRHPSFVEHDLLPYNGLSALSWGFIIMLIFIRLFNLDQCLRFTYWYWYSVLAFVLACLVSWYYSRGQSMYVRAKKTSHLPPGPRGLPFIGNIFGFPGKQHWLKFAELGDIWGTLHSLSFSWLII